MVNFDNELFTFFIRFLSILEQIRPAKLVFLLLVDFQPILPSMQWRDCETREIWWERVSERGWVRERGREIKKKEKIDEAVRTIKIIKIPKKWIKFHQWKNDFSWDEEINEIILLHSDTLNGKAVLFLIRRSTKLKKQYSCIERWQHSYAIPHSLLVQTKTKTLPTKNPLCTKQRCVCIAR